MEKEVQKKLPFFIYINFPIINDKLNEYGVKLRIVKNKRRFNLTIPRFNLPKPYINLIKLRFNLRIMP
ncbi:MAG: hypothetical protein RBT05_07120 [Bacteroidales bacterium]|jgi:hypothetical protein|nr:hypothetical protein [Bacteroidales bacterium]